MEITCGLEQNNQRMLQILPRDSAEMDNGCEKLMQRIKYLDGELGECHTQIFNSLPTDGISDTWIMGNMLCFETIFLTDLKGSLRSTTSR